MECQACHSTNLQRLSLVYDSGLSDVTAHSLSVIGGGLQVYRGTGQSRLSRVAAPPRKQSYIRAILIWFVSCCLLSVALLSTWPHVFGRVSRTSVIGVPTAHRGSVASPPQFPAPGGDTTIEHVCALCLFLWLAVWIWRVRRYNSRVYPAALQKWRSSFMCLRCGVISEIMTTTAIG